MIYHTSHIRPQKPHRLSPHRNPSQAAGEVHVRIFTFPSDCSFYSCVIIVGFHALRDCLAIENAEEILSHGGTPPLLWKSYVSDQAARDSQVTSGAASISGFRCCSLAFGATARGWRSTAHVITKPIVTAGASHRSRPVRSQVMKLLRRTGDLTCKASRVADGTNR